MAACNPASSPALGPAPRKKPSPEVRWPVLKQSHDWPTSTDTWFVARGHYAGTLEALVRVSPDANERYQQHTLGSELKPKSMLIMLHRSQATGKPGPVHAMHKRRDGWEFLLLEPDGRVKERGQLAACARCHAEATSDSVFGPPRLETAE